MYSCIETPWFIMRLSDFIRTLVLSHLHHLSVIRFTGIHECTGTNNEYENWVKKYFHKICQECNPVTAIECISNGAPLDVLVIRADTIHMKTTCIEHSLIVIRQMKIFLLTGHFVWLYMKYVWSTFFSDTGMMMLYINYLHLAFSLVKFSRHYRARRIQKLSCAQLLKLCIFPYRLYMI